MDRRSPWTFLAGAGVALLCLGLAPSRAPSSESSDKLLVTSSLGAQSAVLFVLDSESGTLAAYEATPSTAPEEPGALALLGARRITADLRLTRYRDQSEYSFSELQERYEAAAPTEVDSAAADDGGGSARGRDGS